jgi:hypothetical protein
MPCRGQSRACGGRGGDPKGQDGVSGPVDSLEITVKIHSKALLWGTATFIALYALHLLLLPLLLGTEAGGKETDATLYGIHQFLGLATCLASGFVAAKKAGRLGFVHGLIVGIAGTVLSLVAAILWALATGAVLPAAQTLPFWMFVNGFLGGFAGLVATNMKEDDSAEA